MLRHPRFTLSSAWMTSKVFHCVPFCSIPNPSLVSAWSRPRLRKNSVCSSADPCRPTHAGHPQILTKHPCYSLLLIHRHTRTHPENGAGDQNGLALNSSPTNARMHERKTERLPSPPSAQPRKSVPFCSSVFHPVEKASFFKRLLAHDSHLSRYPAVG